MLAVFHPIFGAHFYARNKSYHGTNNLFLVDIHQKGSMPTIQLGLAWRVLGLQITAVGLMFCNLCSFLVFEMLIRSNIYLQLGQRCVRSGVASVAVILGSLKMLL